MVLRSLSGTKVQSRTGLSDRFHNLPQLHLNPAVGESLSPDARDFSVLVVSRPPTIRHEGMLRVTMMMIGWKIAVELSEALLRLGSKFFECRGGGGEDCKR